MWLRNDILRVFFDERRGGMPTKDNFGFLKASAIEIAYTPKSPSFQSLNDGRPHIEKHGSSLVASGVMRKGGKSTPHTYEMIATLEGNRLNLAYRLNVARTEKITRSKIWLFAGKSLRRCEISGNVLNAIGKTRNWKVLYYGEQLKPSITLLGPSGRLEILGSTIPPVYARVLCFKKYPKLEVIYGWARELLQKGTYSGELALTYKKG